MLGARQRGRHEIELALVLPALGQRSEKWIQVLLRAMSTSDSPGASWTSALARSILRSRSGNIAIERPTSRVESTTKAMPQALAESLWSEAPEGSSTVLNHEHAT